MGVILKNVTKTFRSPDGETSRVVAVDNVSLEIQDGEMVTLLGPSGCGKTTTLRIIAGFEMPDRGRVIIAGEDVTDLPPNKRDTGMVFQSYAIFPHLTVFENIAFGLRLRKLSEVEIKRRVSKILDLVDLSGMARRSPDQLSGGQQQRVALARAIVNEPVVLLFDEPLSNLDAKLREQMRVEIRRIQQNLGITSVYVTHDQGEAMCLSDRIIIMEEGAIVQVGTPQEIYDTPANKFVAEFVGQANFLDAVVLTTSSDETALELYGQRTSIERLKCCAPVGTRMELVVRPETVKLIRADEDPDPTMSVWFHGIVTRAAYMGSLAEYEVDIDGNTLLAVVGSPAEHGLFCVGEKVKTGFPFGVAHPLVSG